MLFEYKRLDAVGDRLMKNIVEINSCDFGSTGTIMRGISSLLEEEEITVYNAYPLFPESKKRNNDIIITSYFFQRVSNKLSYYYGSNGVFAYFATKRLLKKIALIKPDIIHLHNIHNSYINIPLLFNYIKKNNVKIVWTLHDCWSFTGRCPHFQSLGCQKWMSGCYSCKYPKNQYPRVLFDRTKKAWKLKNKWFTGVKDLTIVTPSVWLKELVKESFLKGYQVKVINNGINLSIFKPTESSIREKYNIINKIIILGVASNWSNRKGLDIFIKLSKTLPNDYQIMLVGTDNVIDSILPKSIISIHHTMNAAELASIYSTANIFLNPTREDNYPTVNMEALACGTPVITFKTGGSPETIDDTCGVVVDSNDFESLFTAIQDVSRSKTITKDNCLKKSMSFDMKKKYKEYVELFKDISEK